ncbi:hypothetical protein SmJEL517_g00475 [Synchytrium microbalum]|uniref:AB hydrolase-1 domain-containing protein n=1 Tax=Synchytrium microbalum TaxID=1806994 RepID=A0A507CHQ5_9FUNG|nr:uncharacterized protein SmJEL517_g00475 [Synchytrium microbalum]TPX37584.1 hypothetical protein SmJEL517_g00475 [Synchytrium microbalum]
MGVRVEQLAIPVPSGITLRAKAWGVPPVDNDDACRRAIIASHGWLDNAGSYDLIAPMLAEKAGAYIVCLDLAGHGLSDHRQPHLEYLLWDYVDDMLGVVDYFGWPKANILGHSMGGHISLIFAGTFPDRVSKLCVIESFGPSFKFQDDPKELRDHILKRRALDSGRGKPIYESIEKACLARTKGLTKVSMDAARLLTERGLTRVVEGNQDVGIPGRGLISEEGDDEIETNGGASVDASGVTSVKYTWSTDKRLTLRPFLRWADNAVENFLRAITAPTQLIFGLQTAIWNLDDDFCKTRFTWFGNLRKDLLPGTHHLHLEAETAEAVGDSILEFLELGDDANRPLKKAKGEEN